MLKWIRNQTVLAYEYKDYTLIIEDLGGSYSAWMRRKGIGVQLRIMNVPSDQMSYSEFLKQIEGNLDDYVAEYMRKMLLIRDALGEEQLDT